jgi:hypothetical protein
MPCRITFARLIPLQIFQRLINARGTDLSNSPLSLVRSTSVSFKHLRIIVLNTTQVLLAHKLHDISAVSCSFGSRNTFLQL